MNPLLLFVCEALATALVLIVFNRVSGDAPWWLATKLSRNLYRGTRAKPLAKHPEEDSPRVLAFGIVGLLLVVPGILVINAGISYLLGPAPWEPRFLEVAAIMVGVTIAMTGAAIRQNRLSRRDSA